jgi:hypothetical protein
MTERRSKPASRGARPAKRSTKQPATSRRTPSAKKRVSARKKAPAAKGKAMKTQKQLSSRNAKAPVTTRVMRIRELDPHAACGPGTTVMQLFRVDDLPTASATRHLVFYDRHGWYCEHGRDCPAVAAVRKHMTHGQRLPKAG